MILQVITSVAPGMAMMGLTAFVEHMLICGLETRLSTRQRVWLKVAIGAFVCLFLSYMVTAVFLGSVWLPVVTVVYTTLLVYVLVGDMQNKLIYDSTCMFVGVYEVHNLEQAQVCMPWAVQVIPYGSSNRYMGFGSPFMYRMWHNQMLVATGRYHSVQTHFADDHKS
ncbi:MAG: hypothetical protein ACREBW_01185 [Candidatus Micrarchaeaceae archaeon]